MLFPALPTSSLTLAFQAGLIQQGTRFRLRETQVHHPPVKISHNLRHLTRAKKGRSTLMGMTLFLGMGELFNSSPGRNRQESERSSKCLPSIFLVARSTRLASKPTSLLASDRSPSSSQKPSRPHLPWPYQDTCLMPPLSRSSFLVVTTTPYLFLADLVPRRR